MAEKGTKVLCKGCRGTTPRVVSQSSAFERACAVAIIKKKIIYVVAQRELKSMYTKSNQDSLLNLKTNASLEE